MIADLEKFKLERAEAIKSRDIKKIREFMKNYSINNSLSDAEIMQSIDNLPIWD